ncbi:LPXTG cell wall anchor domain-containing protein [Microbacterium sp. NPDC055910]|uniref:LPXTG cell wall anchor domain-containing protein n=1 Tax=Microbacterium sp. NPDC055910 TaxID=3345659 RepID=UPI0035DCAFBF
MILAAVVVAGTVAGGFTPAIATTLDPEQAPVVATVTDLEVADTGAAQPEAAPPADDAGIAIAADEAAIAESTDDAVVPETDLEAVAPEAAAAKTGASGAVSTFAAGPMPMCQSNYVYSVSSSGTVRQIVNGSGNNTAAVTTFGSWPGSFTGVNSLAIGPNGSVMYAINRSANNNAADVLNVLRYTQATGVWETLPNTGLTTGNSTSLVAGAVNLANGRFLIGGFDSEYRGMPYFRNEYRFMLYEFDPVRYAADPATAYRTLGYFWTGATTGQQNGDMAFDSSGNLYVVRSDDSGTTNIFSVTAATLAAAQGGLLTRSQTNASDGIRISAVNGIAFEADGTIYLGNGTTIERYNPTTWQRLQRVTTSLSSSTDLAGCNSPANLTVQKNVVGRAAPTDQFRLEVGSGNTVVATATTVGTSTGIQSEQIGPIPVVAGAEYRIAETMASGSATDYASSWTCTRDGAVVASGQGASGTIRIPSVNGASVACVFTNAPLVTPVTITKTVLDDRGENPRPGAGWTMGLSATATGGTVTKVAGNTPEGTTNAAGAASWTLRYGSSAARATLSVSETQQAGHEFVSGQCTVTAPSGASSTITLTSEAAQAIGDVAPGSTVQCAYVNKLKPTSLTLVKKVEGDADPATWTLTAQALAPSGALPGPSGSSGTDAATAAVTAGVPYALSEDDPVATYVRHGEWTCLDQDDVLVAVDGDTVTIREAGDQVTCTITNATARLTILKHVVDGSQLDPADFTLTATPAAGPALEPVATRGTASIADADTFEVRPDHAYTLAESTDSATIAYRNLALQRLTPGGDPAVDADWTDVDAAAITIAPGEHATYRFVNDRIPAVVLPLTGGTSADMFLMLGAAIMAALAGLGVWHATRRAKSAS